MYEPVYQEATFDVFDFYGATFVDLYGEDGTGSSFFNRMSFETLQWIYDSLDYIPADDFLDFRDVEEDFLDLGDFLIFDQTEFAPDADFTTGDLEDQEFGVAYIPS